MHLTQHDDTTFMQYLVCDWLISFEHRMLGKYLHTGKFIGQSQSPHVVLWWMQGEPALVIKSLMTLLALQEPPKEEHMVSSC